MVTIHEKNARNFNTLGLGALLPSSCVVTEELNGSYELELTHPRDEEGKWKRIEEERILYASTPRGKQPFRIYRIKPTMSGITVNAKHIFYDLLDNQCEAVSFNGAAPDALAALQEAFAYEMPFSFDTNITLSGTLATGRMNPIQALLSDDDETTSFVKGFGGELLRDGFHVSLKAAVGLDRDVAIRYGKNLIGLEVLQDASDVKTRIICYGSNGTAVVDSPYIGKYVYPKIHMLEDDGKKIAELKKEAQDLLDGGIDIPSVNIKVDFVALTKTVEYKDYAVLEEVFLGDLVTVINTKMNFRKKAKVISYEWDCLLDQYNEVKLGDFIPTLASSVTSGVRSWNLASAAVVNASAVMATLQDHMNDKNNPHEVTAEQTGGSSGGSSLPDVTTEDNGKVLMVDAGSWAAKELEKYLGEYDVTPTTEAVVLSTAKLLMSGDVTVQAIPQSILDAEYQRGYDEAYELYKPYKQELAYIESTGTQYIDTNFYPSGNELRVKMKFKYTSSHASLSLFGNHNTTPYSITPYGAKPVFYVGNTNRISCGNQTSLNTAYELDVTADNGTLTAVWNGVTYTAYYSGSLYTVLSVFIFGSNSGSGVVETGAGYQLEYIQFYDNGTLVRDYIPVLDWDDVPCLYDKVKRKFHYNAGSGTFAYA